MPAGFARRPNRRWVSFCRAGWILRSWRRSCGALARPCKPSRSDSKIRAMTRPVTPKRWPGTWAPPIRRNSFARPRRCRSCPTGAICSTSHSATARASQPFWPRPWPRGRSKWSCWRMVPTSCLGHINPTRPPSIACIRRNTEQRSAEWRASSPPSYHGIVSSGSRPIDRPAPMPAAALAED